MAGGEELSGRLAVVTGGASGIGLALARCFGAERMKVVLADVEAEALDGAVGELEALGIECRGVQTDVSRADDVQSGPIALEGLLKEELDAADRLCHRGARPAFGIFDIEKVLS